ncbi:MAG: CoA transferase [Segniliparus sp.]|uniref:CoA transferase n=1 Tax=Segniliparus sp. TaxID=2804064 RepID=UPI003F32B286
MTTSDKVPVPIGLTSAPDIDADFKALMDSIGLDAGDTGGDIRFIGEDPILPSNHRLGAIMALGMMAPAAATQILYRMRGGPAQDLSVDLRKAVAHINPAYMFTPTAGGYPVLPAGAAGNPFGFGIYPTRDGRWYLPTAVYPKMFVQWLGLLKAGFETKAVEKAISLWDGQDLEDAAGELGMIGTMIRTPEEWYAHPQGSYLAQTPMIEIVKIGDSEPELPPLTNPDRPLSGIKVASMVHVIAGPTTCRTLAEQGAQILDLSSPAVEYTALVADCHVGMRSTWSDLKQEKYCEQARRLVSGADVFVENYRGRKIEELGFGAEQVAEIRPGIVYASIRGFGWDGPWTNRGGFDMDANCCTGYATLEGTPDQPKLPPTLILNDYLAGYLTSAGVLAALILRAKHGGSYHVRVSLSRFSMWYSQLGVFHRDYVAEAIQRPDHRPIAPVGMSLNSGFGKLERLEPGIAYSKTPGFWENPDGGPVVGPLGSSEPVWIP